MDITKSLNFYLNDPRRNEKLITGTAVVLISTILSSILIGLVGFIILTGYAIRLLQNVRDGQEHPLPEWDRWSEDLNVGFKYIVAILVYALPLMVLWIPIVVGTAITDGNRNTGIIGFPLMALGICLVFLYAIFITLATPGITVAFARDEQIRSAFDYTTIWAWTRDHIGPIIVVTLVYLAASFVLGIVGALVGTLLCVVGLIVTIPLATLLTTLVQYHLYGQLAHEFGAPVRGSVHALPMLPAPMAPAAPTAPQSPLADEPRVTYVAPASPADFAISTDAPAADTTPIDVGPIDGGAVEIAPDTIAPDTIAPDTSALDTSALDTSASDSDNPHDSAQL